MRLFNNPQSGKKPLKRIHVFGLDGFGLMAKHCSSVVFWPLSLRLPFQLPGGRSDESRPQRPADERPHGRRSGPGQTEALRLLAAGPSKPAQQEGAAPHDDAAGSRQPLEEIFFADAITESFLLRGHECFEQLLDARGWYVLYGMIGDGRWELVQNPNAAHLAVIAFIPIPLALTAQVKC